MVKMTSRSRTLRVVCGILLVVTVTSAAWARPCFRCKHEPVVMPVSLAKGTTVRTTEFLVKNIEYHIDIRVKRGLPFGQLSCMIGGKGQPSHCAMFHWDNVIDAEWKVLDGEHIVAQGTTPGYGDMAWSSSDMDRYLGEFLGKANKKYVVEVKFTKDGTALNKLNPRLIVRMIDF